MSVQFSVEDLKTPERLERVLRQFQSAIDSTSKSSSPALPSLSALALQLAPLIRDQLQSNGIAPINLQSLLPAVGVAVFIEDTHANRLTLRTPPSTANIALIETDRSVLYASELSGGSLVWVYLAGVMVSALANRPADLGVNDTGFLFYATDTTQLTKYIWTGTAWITVGGALEILTDAATNTISTVLTLVHLSSGLAAVGYGARNLVQLQNTTPAQVDGSSLDTAWTNATAGSETSSWAVRLRNAGAALTNFFQVLVTGIKFKVGGFFGIFVHANTADRTYTFPDLTDMVVLLTAVQTLTNKKIGDPTDSSKALAFDLSFATAGKVTTFLCAQSDFRTVVFPDATGFLTYENGGLPTGNFLLGGNGGALVADAGFSIVPVASGGTGIAYNRIADTIARTNQSADITTTNFNGVITPGTYRVSYSLQDTASDVTAGTVTLTVGYTDGAGATTKTATQVLTGVGRTDGVFFLQAASGNVTWAISHTGLFGSAKYSLYICFERLS